MYHKKQKKSSTIKEMQRQYSGIIDSFDLELILAFALKKSREYILAHPDRILTAGEHKKIIAMLKRRIDGEPLAYITGHKEFYGMDFYVNKSVLIPRPETEHQVDQALSIIKKTEAPMTIIDVGTGSGCIIISVAKHLRPSAGRQTSENNFPNDSKFLAIDNSKKALTVARKNAKIHGLDKDIKFLPGNLLEPIFSKSKISNVKPRILFLANLPYISKNDYPGLTTIRHEPKSALISGADGLGHYRELFIQLRSLYKSTQGKIEVLCEIDPSQAQAIKKLAQAIPCASGSKFTKDYSGRYRIFSFSIHH